MMTFISCSVLYCWSSFVWGEGRWMAWWKGGDYGGGNSIDKIESKIQNNLHHTIVAVVIAFSISYKWPSNVCAECLECATVMHILHTLYVATNGLH